MKKLSKNFNKIAAVFFAVLTLFAAVFIGNVTKVFAADSAATAYEQSNVLDDLHSTVVDGKPLDLSCYDFDERKKPELVTFTEYCYSAQSSKQAAFALYVAVYNPQNCDFTKNEQLNKIQLRVSGKASDSFEKYSLKYLNKSSDGLFYKFKVAFTDGERVDVLSKLNSVKRSYEVSGIELFSGGTNATEYPVKNKYVYTGYMAGYGDGDKNTLSCKPEGLDLTLELDVHQATFTPEFLDGTNSYTQDMLHSVYFSIPKKIIKDFGGLSAVHAQWLNALTAPIYVTGNQDVYNDILNRVLKDNGVPGDSVYALLANTDLSTGIQYQQCSADADYAYNIANVAGYLDNSGLLNLFHDIYYGYDNSSSAKLNLQLDKLSYAFYAENGDADNYTLSSEKLREWFRIYTEEYGLGDNPVLGKYNRALFSKVDEKFTDINIQATDKYTLVNQKLDKNFWQLLFGGGTFVDQGSYVDQKAIVEVSEIDFEGDTSVISKALLIDESYVPDFKDFYKQATAKDETVYLLRYYQSKYESREVTEFERVPLAVLGFIDLPTYGLRSIDTNAYLAQSWCNLDFDIIDVTCRKGNIKTVIANIASPKDNIPDNTPPVITTPEPEDKFAWLRIVGIVLVVLILVVLLILIFKVIDKLFRRKKE